MKSFNPSKVCMFGWLFIGVLIYDLSVVHMELVVVDWLMFIRRVLYGLDVQVYSLQSILLVSTYALFWFLKIMLWPQHTFSGQSADMDWWVALLNNLDAWLILPDCSELHALFVASRWRRYHSATLIRFYRKNMFTGGLDEKNILYSLNLS